MTQGSWAALSIAIILALAGCKGESTVGLMPCTSNANCSATQFCTAGSCYPKVATGSCAATSEHTAADVCTSGVCLAGACCTAACASSDPDCKATSCDPTSGACVYPTSTATCGPAESCASGSHTAASACNGQGACTLAQPTPCTTHACFDTHRCVATCTDNSGCAATEFCSSGQCTPKLAAGAVCGPTSTSSAGTDCTSGSCLGTRCCTAACATTDAQCGATDCDSTGACVYPAQTVTCGALQSCTGPFYTPQSACDGKGSCAPGTPQSCEPYICNEPGAICYASCTAGGSECAADSYCDAQKCALKGGPGKSCATTTTSNADQACLSSICSVNCCVIDCAVDPTTHNGCKGTCDSSGACTGQTCPNNFGCSGTVTCNTKCATNADCDSAGFCDPVGATACCSKYVKGDTIYIDGSNGSDANPCCGAQATPCQTLTHAMAMVDGSGVSGVLLWVANSDGTTTWTANETYPIHLGWGVTLHAPSIYFTSQTLYAFGSAHDVFQVYAYDPTDTGTVTIEGGGSQDLSDAVYIGFDPQLDAKTSTTLAYWNSKTGVNDAVTGKTSLPLILSQVWLNSRDNTEEAYDLLVGGGALVTLGPNPVKIGSGDHNGDSMDPYYLHTAHGIYCKGAGAVIQDDSTSAGPVLSIDTRYSDFIDVEDGCEVTLTQGPVLGSRRRFPVGWDGTSANCPAGDYCELDCGSYFPNSAVMVVGSGKVTFGSANMPGLVQCAVYGFDEETSNQSGSPTIVVDSTTIDLVTYVSWYTTNTPPYYQTTSACAGAIVTEGTFSATSSTFMHSYVGVFAGGNAVSVDLSGGGNGGNAFNCNNFYHPSGPGSQYTCVGLNSMMPPLGASVVNATATVAINAESAAWDDYDATSSSTQVWSCSDTTYSNCTCSGASCSLYTSPGAPPNGTDAIYLSTNTAASPLDTSAGSQSSAAYCYQL